MAMGDAGDEFAEQVLRATMDIAKDILRYIDGVGMPHTGWKDRYESERDRVREAAEAAFIEEGEDQLEEGATWLWAPNAKEADELAAFLERKSLEYDRARPRKSDGVVKVKVFHNDDCVPVAEGGQFNPVDYDDAEIAEVFDAYSWKQCMEHLSVLADAEAMKKALVEASENIKYVPGSPDNCIFRFSTVQWDQDGSVLLDYLDRAGIENESWLCEIPAVDMGLEEGEDVPGVAVEFNAKNAPHVQAAVGALLKSGIRGLDQKRFPGFGQAMKDAQVKASEIYSREAGLGYERMSVPDQAAAEQVRGLLMKEGVACAAVSHGETGDWELVVDRADAIASQWRIHQLASDYEKVASQAKERAEALAPAKAKTKGKSVEKIQAKTRSRKYSKEQRDTPARDESVGRHGAQNVNRSMARGVSMDTPSITPKRPSR